MSKMRWLCVALAAFLVLGSVAMAGQDKDKAGEAKKAKHQARKGGRGGMTPEKMLAHYAETLGLSAGQQEDVKKVLDAYMAGMEAIKAQFKDLYAGIKDKKDKAAMEGIAEKKKELMQDMKDLREQKDKDILALLTADQKEKFEKAMAQHKGRGKKGEGKGEKKGDRPHGKKGRKDKPDA